MEPKTIILLHITYSAFEYTDRLSISAYTRITQRSSFLANSVYRYFHSGINGKV